MPLVADVAVRSKKEALARRRLAGEVSYDPVLRQSHVRYLVKGEPLVSLIIPTRNHSEELERCVAALEGRTEYRNYDVTIIDNRSDDPHTLMYVAGLSKRRGFRVIRSDMNFNFSALNNLAAKDARGEYFLFMNNDTEVQSPGWMDSMLGLAQLDHVGAVGAKLLYPTGKVQHAGVVMYAGGPDHAFNGMNPSRIANLRFHMDGNWLAVTGACMMVNRHKFFQAGSFDEGLAVSYNDVGLCLALRECGYYNMLAHDAVLVHHEFRSRGHDEMDPVRRSRQLRELELLLSRFPQYRGRDPFYSVNLAQDRKDFSLKTKRLFHQDTKDELRR